MNIEPRGTFQLEGVISLEVEHFVKDSVLEVYFRGGFMGRYDVKFERFIEHTEWLVEATADGAIDSVECHLEAFGEALSRTQHTVYRMVHGMRAHVASLIIFASDRTPESGEHLRMAELFVNGLAGQPGAKMEVVKL